MEESTFKAYMKYGIHFIYDEASKKKEEKSRRNEWEGKSGKDIKHRPKFLN